MRLFKLVDEDVQYNRPCCDGKQDAEKRSVKMGIMIYVIASTL